MFFTTWRGNRKLQNLAKFLRVIVAIVKKTIATKKPKFLRFDERFIVINKLPAERIVAEIFMEFNVLRSTIKRLETNKGELIRVTNELKVKHGNEISKKIRTKTMSVSQWSSIYMSGFN